MLRDYQLTAYEAIRQSFMRGNRAPVLQLPTGGGKTVTGSYAISKTIAKQNKVTGRYNRVLVLVHRVELVKQWRATLENLFGVTPGIIAPTAPRNKAALCQIAMVQTMVNRLHEFSKFDLIIVDECHHTNATTYMKILSYYNTRVLGLTATPQRADGKGLGINHGGVYDDLILGPTVRELIDMGSLVKPIMYLPPTDIDLSDVGTVAGDYTKGKLAAAMNKPSITGDAVAQYTKICPGVPCVVFCVNVAHANSVAAAFRVAGYRAESVDGKTEPTERLRILNGLATGSVQVVTSCDIISEGTDIPAIGCAILLRPTKSLVLFLQQVGRALRLFAGKTAAVIFDHVGNIGKMTPSGVVLNHGTPDMDRDWTLEGGAEKKKREKQDGEKNIRLITCESCYAVSEFKQCPQCGHINAVKERKLQTHDGELKQLSDTQIAQLREKKEKNREVGMAKTLDQLKAIAAARGYKPQWAQHIYDSRQKKKMEI